MSNNDYILKLYKKKDELYKICYYHNIYGDDADDILQELYVKLLLKENINRYVDSGEPNMYIVFMIIRNLIIDKYNKEKKYIKEELYDIPDDEPVEYDKIDFIKTEMEKVEYWFDRNIIKIYFNEEHTLRSLSKATKIGKHFLHPVIYNFKIKCRKNYKIYIKNKNKKL